MLATGTVKWFNGQKGYGFTHMDEWHAQLDAEKDFMQKQYAVAEYRPSDLNELGLMAAAAAAYDKAHLTYGQTAFGVVLAFFRLCVPPTA